MSQIPYFPLDSTGEVLPMPNHEFKIKGQIIAPFDMIEITNDNYFNDIAQPDLHIFVSTDPLFDDCYWMMYLTTPDRLPDMISNSAITFFQNYPLANQGSFYLTRLKKPFAINKVNQGNERVSPYTYLSRQGRIGKIPGVYFANETQNKWVITLDNLNPDKIYTNLDVRQMLGGI